MAFSSGKINKYENFTGEEILPPVQSRMIENAKFFRKNFWKTNKNISGLEEKQIKVTKDHWKQIVTYNTVIKKY